MQLFQNRAGLKKAYADLQDELHLLHDRLKQQEGATIRIQEQTDALAELLGDPKLGPGALVYFQLRALWKICHQQLTAFVQELTRQQETREIARHKIESQSAVATQLADIDTRLSAAAAHADAQREQFTTAQLVISRLTAFWHYFERRRRIKELATIRNAEQVADATVGELHAARSAMLSEAAPEFSGISLATRRSINMAVMGYAEILCETIDAYGVTSKTKESVARRVHEMTFGSAAECNDYMHRVQQARNAVTGQKPPMGAVKVKLDRLRSTCEYRNSEDTVPTTDSLSTANTAPVWNVLADDYWDIYTLLLR